MGQTLPSGMGVANLRWRGGVGRGKYHRPERKVPQQWQGQERRLQQELVQVWWQERLGEERRRPEGLGQRDIVDGAGGGTTGASRCSRIEAEAIEAKEIDT